MASSPGDYIANRDQFKIARARAFNRGDSYTVANGIVDVSKQVGTMRAGSMSVIAALGVMGVGVTGVSLPALLAVGKVLGIASVVAKAADTAAEQFAPRIYHKHIGKIK